MSYASQGEKKQQLATSQLRQDNATDRDTIQVEVVFPASLYACGDALTRLPRPAQGRANNALAEPPNSGRISGR
jgi:hypothetical protein